MIPWIAAAFSVIVFIILIRLFRLVERSLDVVGISRNSLDIVRDSGLDDKAKEEALQKNALSLFRLFFVLAGSGAAAVSVPLGMLWCCERFGWLSLEAVYSVAVSPVFLIASGVATVFALRAGRSEKTYTAMDRWLHYLSFKTHTAQISLADFEDRLYANKLAACDESRPIFITALPRAGTTLLLECCAKLPELATHCYRDMPFVLIPCFWSRFSASFQQTGELRERAHGDGMLIDFDSPEAFEEVLWKAFWPRHYKDDRITPWMEEDGEGFEDFFRGHMRKIILLRCGEHVDGMRYVSKNNANIGRIRWLKSRFPNLAVLIPFREPLQHATSLRAQHLNFLGIHKEDRFSAEYMRAIGHFDFGRNLRPIDFDNWLDNRMSDDAGELVFWLEYWVAAYRYLMREHMDSVHFVHYEGLCENPGHGLRVISEAIGCNPGHLLPTAKTIRLARPREVDTGAVPPSLLAKANDIHAELKQLALNSQGHQSLAHDKP